MLNIVFYFSRKGAKLAKKKKPLTSLRTLRLCVPPKHILVFFILNSSFLISFSQLPNTDIWLLDIKDDKGKITFSNPVNITNREGYDNQPAFSPDGKYILFSSVREGVQSDIYKYDIASKQTTQFTKTEESEYSPTFMPGGKFISTVRVEKDSTQRLWKFPVNGGEPELVLKTVKNVGYHCWVDKETLALLILPAPFTLQIANINTEKTTLLDTSIGRCVQKMSAKDIGSYYKKTSDSTGLIGIFDSWLMKTHLNIQALNKSEDFVWYNGNLLIMGKKSILYKRDQRLPAKIEKYIFIDDAPFPGDPFYESPKIEKKISDSFSILQDLSNFGINNIGRIALSPDKKKIALVTTK